ncbi:MAG: hypothetical protein IPM85_15990 [Chitinophagaceae bacterium]|nr:hypothetical protein [Chitinophagaceae bacterium]
MLKQLFISYFLLTTIVSYSQQQQLSDFYPSAGKVDKAIIGKAQFLTTGCAEGNCENGNGKYVVVKFVDQGNYKEQYFGQLCYTIYSGEFSGKDSSFKGQCLQLIIKVTMKKGGKVYTPDERQPDFSKAKMISAGSFRKKRFEKNNIVQDAYVKHGIVKLFEWENKYSYTEYQSISGYYFDDKLKYAHIVYPDNYQMGTKWFTGIVTAKGKPVMGIRQTTKGLVENYRPYEQLAGDFANKLYDTTLLLSLVKKM